MLLAKCGVGQLRLVDYDVVMPGNVSRHACGFYSVGMSKTWAVGSAFGNTSPIAASTLCRRPMQGVELPALSAIAIW